MNTSKRINACRACGSTDLADLFSLGDQYVSTFVTGPPVLGGDHPPRCPIEIVLCRACTLAQQRWTAPQEFMYTRHYWYRSGVTQTMRDALAEIARDAARVADLRPNDVVLDIGSNDGTLLRAFKKVEPQCITVGVEPAENFYEDGVKQFKFWLKDFWGTPRCLAGLINVRAKIVSAIGMFYDSDDPNAFIADVAEALAPGGVFVAQLMCLRDMIESNDVGNLCHEHLEFYTLKSLQTLFAKHGLEIFDVERNRINGRSTRLWVARAGERPVTFAARQQFHQDADCESADVIKDWWNRVTDNLIECRGFIVDAARSGKRVWVYGASTKGNVLLQWWGLGPESFEATADRSPEKWGKLTVGTNIPICSEEAFRHAQPDYAVVLPWGFIDEFVERERAWLLAGGKFAVPLPRFRLVGKEALK